MEGRMKRPNGEEAMEGKDRISDLPNSILLDILGFLYMPDAVKTSVLSKRWNRLWTEIPWLMYEEATYDPSSSKTKREKFIDSVNFTLLSRQETSTIIQFDLQCVISKHALEDMNGEEKSEVIRFINHVDTWVGFAVRREVEILVLDFSKSCHDDNGVFRELAGTAYKLPHHLYSNDTIQDLILSFCIIKPTKPIEWSSLTSLSLFHIELSDELIQDILSGAPLLHELELSNFCATGGMRNINVNSRSLKCLALHLFPGSRVQLSVPYVETLKINYHIENFLLKDASSLLDVHLIPYCGTLDDDTCQDTLRSLLQSTQRAKSLTLSTSAIQVLSMINVRYCVISPSNCNLLRLRIKRISKWDLPGIAALLATSHTLQTLILQMSEESNDDSEGFFLNSGSLQKKYDFDETDYWNSLSVPHCLRKSLHTVKIFDFVIGPFETELLEFLLQRARFLQKMVIYAKKTEAISATNDMLKFSQKLSRITRASPEAEVLFL